jgi:hypothetical protein
VSFVYRKILSLSVEKMSEASEQEKKSQVDTQSVQSETVQQSTSATHSQQVRSSSQAERSGRSERQRIQRSSSSSSSSTSISTGGQVIGQTSTGSHQQYSSGSGYANQGAAGGSYGASGGSFGSAVSGERRQGRHRRQVIRLPDQPQGQVRQVRHRLPTPEPDTLERV